MSVKTKHSCFSQGILNFFSLSYGIVCNQMSMQNKKLSKSQFGWLYGQVTTLTMESSQVRPQTYQTIKYMNPNITYKLQRY